MTDVAQDVIAIIAKKVRVDRPNIKLDDRLPDLGLESVDAIELIFELEEKFDVEIAYNANDSQSGFETVGQVVNAIEGLVAKKKTAKA